MFLGLSELSNVYSTHHDDPSDATESQDAATDAANPGHQRQDSSEGMSPPSCQALGQMVQERETRASCAGPSSTTRGAIISDKGEITGTNKSIQRKLVTDEEKHHSSWMVEGRTELGAGRGRRSQEVAGRGPCGSPSSPEQSNRSSIPRGAMEEWHASRNCWRQTRNQPVNKDRLGGIKRTKAMWERWYEAILQEEKPQGSKDIAVQCVDFCEAMTSKVHAVLQYAPFDLRGGTFRQHPRVLVATVDYQENPHLCMQILHAAMFQVSRGSYILLRVLAVTKNQETLWLLDEIQRQPGVLVLSGPATEITNIATASAFLADGWSTESVSRVVRTARTRQENNERERAEHSYYSHMHDEVSISNSFTVTGQGLEEDESLPEDTQHRMTRTMKENSPYPTHCRDDDKLPELMRTWSTHRIARWYECHVSVEPSTGVVLVRHRNVQPFQS